MCQKIGGQPSFSFHYTEETDAGMMVTGTGNYGHQCAMEDKLKGSV